MPTYTPDPTVAPVGATGGIFAGLLGAGIAGFVLAAVVYVLLFIFAAWLTGWFLRLMVRFHRSWFDREYARMRGQAAMPSRRRGPRDWGNQGPTFFS